MFTILLCWWFSFFHDQETASIKALFAAKQAAVQGGDLSAFIETIYPDQHYRQEQKHWFFDAIKYVELNSFQIRVKHIRYVAPNTYQVVITQSYSRLKNHYTVTFPVIVRKTATGMKDADSFLYEIKKGPLTVKYSDVHILKQAKQALIILQHNADRLNRIYHWQPDPVEVKLYHDPEWFRQSVKLSLPSWVGGWNEAKQAIKLVVGQMNVGVLNHGLAHEYTHQLVSGLTNDNAAYWLQEGAAMYYEAMLTGEKPQITSNFKPFSILDLEQIHLEMLSDEDASEYYLSCYEQFRNLVNQYGEAKMSQLFVKLRQFAYIDLDSSMKQKETNLRTRISLRDVGMLFPDEGEVCNANKKSS